MLTARMLLVGLIIVALPASLQAQLQLARQPLNLPTSCVLIANLKVTRELIPFTGWQQDRMVELLDQSKKDIRELLNQYRALKITDEANWWSTYCEYTKKLAAKAAEHDAAAMKYLGKHGSRVEEICQQLMGPERIIYGRTNQFREFDISDEQVNRLSAFFQKIFIESSEKRRKLKTKEERLQFEAERSRQRYLHVSRIIFDEHQRVVWHEMTGKPITDDQYIRMYVELETLKKSLSR